MNKIDESLTLINIFEKKYTHVMNTLCIYINIVSFSKNVKVFYPYV